MEPIRGRENAAEAVRVFRDAMGPLRLTPYIPWVPHPAQEAFLRLDTLEAFFGGAAGPGKSTALLMAALQYVDVPGYAALLLRKTYADLALPGALMDKASDWLAPTDARWNNTTKTWEFPSRATLTFGYLATEVHKHRYQSAEFQFIGFDELTQFTETMYTYLFGRLRRPDTMVQGIATDGTSLDQVPLRMRSASNPGGTGHQWVNDRLVDPDTRNRKAIFVPAHLDENPSLDRPTYLQSLGELDPTTKAMMLDGNWKIQPPGTHFAYQDFHVLDQLPGDAVKTIRYWDLAATEVSEAAKDPDWSCGLRYSVNADGIFTIEHVDHFRENEAIVQARMRTIADADGHGVPVIIEQEPGSAGKNIVKAYARTTLKGYQVYPHRPEGDKELRARFPSAAAKNSLVRIVRGPWMLPFLSEVCAFPNAAHDDQLDAFTGAHAVLSGRARAAGRRTSNPASRTMPTPGDAARAM